MNKDIALGFVIGVGVVLAYQWAMTPGKPRF